MQRESQDTGESIHPHTMIVSPHENRLEAEAPMAIGAPGDPRTLAAIRLDTDLYMTETPEQQTPPTNGEVATDLRPPTDEGLAHVDDGLDGNTEPPPPDPPETTRGGVDDDLGEQDFASLTPDRPRPPVSDKQPQVATTKAWMDPPPEDDEDD